MASFSLSLIVCQPYSPTAGQSLKERTWAKTLWMLLFCQPSQTAMSESIDHSYSYLLLHICWALCARFQVSLKNTYFDLSLSTPAFTSFVTVCLSDCWHSESQSSLPTFMLHEVLLESATATSVVAHSSQGKCSYVQDCLWGRVCDLC